MEYSLVFFTVLSQLATAFAVITAFGTFSSLAGNNILQRYFIRIAGILCFPVTIAAGAASFFHLGDPWGALRAFSHIETSWLSREIWAAGIFGGCALLCSAVWWKPRSLGQRRFWSFATAISGLITVMTSSKVYQLAAQPVWDNIFTPLSFIATTLLFIPVIAASILTWNKFKADDAPEWSKFTGWAAWGMIGAAILQLMLIGAHTYYFMQIGSALSGYVLVKMGAVYWGRILLSVVFPVFLGGWILRKTYISTGCIGPAAVSFIVLVLFGELGGRILFFSSVLNSARF